MRIGVRPRAGAALLLALAVVGTLALLFVQATRHDESPFLAHEEPAEWILYPMAPVSVRPKGELETVFVRRFSLAAVPARAPLAVRMYRAGSLAINGTPVPFSPLPAVGWKRAHEGDVAALLRPGENEIEARVRTAFGPPALWLALEAGGLRVTSDESWTTSLMGAEDAPARLATTPLDRWPRGVRDPAQLDAENPRPRAALRAQALPIALCFAAGAFLAFGASLALRRGASARAVWLAWGLVAAAWLALFVNNQALHPQWGFDAGAHRTYVKVVLQEGRVPLADEGWQTYQPPLYYGLAAGWLALGGFTSTGPEAIAFVRWLGLAAALLQALFVLLALRELFPERPGLVLAAFVFGASLPVNLYMFQMVTNEPWAAMLSCGAVWWTIRMLRRGSTRLRDDAILGAFLGLAMLAKFSALIPLVLCPSVVLAQRVLRAERRAGSLALGLATTLAVVFAVCGWHFVRVALHFGGNPFVGNWDAESGQAWWQDPGYHVLGDYLRFGLALERPLMSAVAGVPDALYSTLWGDGMLSGVGNVRTPPPWNLSWMAAGYWIALGPCLALLLGVVLGFVDFLREPRAERFLALALLGATVYALLNMTLRLPFYTQAKSFYGLSALVPLSFCFALGFDALALRWRGVRALGAVWLAGWAVLTFATYFGAEDALAMDPLEVERAEDTPLLDPGGHIAAAKQALAAGRDDAALAALDAALARNPDQAGLEVMRVDLLRRMGRSEEALAAVRAALRVSPAGQPLHLAAGELWRERGDPARAAFHFGAAARLLPSTITGHIDAARRSQIEALRAAGRWAEAIAVLDALRAEAALSRDGVRLFAALLLDAPAPLRDVERAHAFAVEADAAAGGRDAVTAELRAAAEAASGREEEAVATQELAVGLWKEKGDEEAVGRAEERLEEYRRAAGMPER